MDASSTIDCRRLHHIRAPEDSFLACEVSRKIVEAVGQLADRLAGDLHLMACDGLDQGLTLGEPPGLVPPAAMPDFGIVVMGFPLARQLVHTRHPGCVAARGEGGYRSPDGGGDVQSTLTGLYPYGHYAVSDRLSVWGVAGYGEGSLTLTPEGQAPMETDMDLTLACAGLRSVMVAAPAEGGLERAANSDGFVVRTSSDRVQGLAAANAEVTRLRLGLEGTWRGGSLVPSVEIGVRHDGGDAETGFGADIGAGLAWSDPASGIAAEVRGRGLLTHADGDFRESGFAGSLAWDPTPSSARGPTLRLSQTVGAQASGGVDSLLSRPTMAGLAANDDEGGTFDSRRLEARLGYGFAVFGDRFVATPEIGLGLSDTGRDYSLGWRLALARSHRVGFDLALEGTRREAANDDRVPEHGLRLRGGLRLRAALRW